MKRRSKEKSQESMGSRLLSPQENEKVIDLLGRRCMSLCSTVVQLFMALPHSPGNWSLQNTGVLCFIKDNPQRSYFIRLYDITASKLVWEQELFNQFTYHRAQPFFHTFHADDCQVGINFASEEEAENFFYIVDEKINQRSKHLEKKGKGVTQSQDHDALPPLPPNGSGTPLATINIQNQATPIKSKKDKKEKEKDKKNKKKGSKLSKALIGAPSGFTHVGHLGMGGNSMDPDLMKLLTRAGISEADMRDTETSQLIYDVIERSGGMEAVKKELNQDGRPPPPPPGARRTSLPPVPPGSSSAPQARLGPLPPPPGESPSTGPRSTSVRSLPPTPSGGRTGPLPPPPGAHGGRRGPLPQVPGSQSLPSARSGPLPPVPGAHSGPPPPPTSDRGGPQSSATFSRSGPLPPLPGRGSALSAPAHRSAPQRPASRDQTAPMPFAHSAGSVPPLPGRRTESLPQPTNDECYLLPPPTFDEDFPPPPCSDFPLDDMNLPPPPLPSESFPPPPIPHPASAHSSTGAPPPPPPPPPPPAAPAAPARNSDQSKPKPPIASSGGGGRGALLDQIRIGTKLKTVTGPDPAQSATQDTEEGIVGALMMVMQKRSKVIHSSDEGDEFDDEEEDDDEWD
ncbi:neural Wiskott-Aldrich syndrome protein isoform X1 [Silurus meridionalis]|uniref:Wiskott-Aldrich syndrome protein-like n=2 Tax=Silurus meridionalis TaxID=175797 RepID=A0A8T0ASJ0_SILME|nr:neural Wiskott-Aldrich syndrome protein isoform X1 [Silurus meridionalis]KAF7695375.1 hypothetical protein HF521_007098 [Silurus meridionalis]